MGKNRKALVAVELEPWSTPNFAHVAGTEGDDHRSIPLRDIDAHTLATMCDDFRDAVFKKAGKEPPKERTPTRGPSDA